MNLPVVRFSVVTRDSGDYGYYAKITSDCNFPSVKWRKGMSCSSTRELVNTEVFKNYYTEVVI